MRPLQVTVALLTIGSLGRIALAADAYAGTPYGDKPVELPGVVQAEAYDVAPGAANGVTFNYNGDIRKGDLRTTGDCIGLAKFGGGHVSVTGQAEDANQAYVGWTHEGEWLKYSVHVDQPGTYLIGAKLSAAGDNGKISFTFTPDKTTGPVAVPTTSGKQPGVESYHVWEQLDNMAEVNLAAGNYVLTVKIETGAGINMDYFTFRKK